MEITLAGFVEDQPASTETLHDVGALVQEIDNDSLLAILRGAGLASSFGDVRNFLTQLRFLSQHPPPSGAVMTPGMREGLALTLSVLSQACQSDGNAPTGSDRVALGDTDDAPDAAGQPVAGPGAPGNGFKDWAGRSPEQIALLLQQAEESQSVGVLGLMLVILALLIVLSFALRYGLLFLQVARQGRQICSIPVELTCMFEIIPGQITLLGRYGFRFSPEKASEGAFPHGLSPGTYGQVLIGKKTFDIKLDAWGEDVWSVLFIEPLLQPQIAKALVWSEVRPRLDFSVLTSDKATQRAFAKFATGGP